MASQLASLRSRRSVEPVSRAGGCPRIRASSVPRCSVTYSTRGALYRTGARDHQRDTGASTWLSASADAADRFGSGGGPQTRSDRWSLSSSKGWRRGGQRLDPTQGEPAPSHPSSGKARGCAQTFRPTFTTSLQIRDSQKAKPLDGCALCSTCEPDSRGKPRAAARGRACRRRGTFLPGNPGFPLG
jgi:hypothetical protein